MNKEKLNIIWEKIKKDNDIKNDINTIKRKTQISQYIDEILKLDINEILPDKDEELPLLYEIKTTKSEKRQINKNNAFRYKL